MSSQPPLHGQCDAADRLIAADEPLAGLQVRCGGEMPGLLAVPALLTLVRRTRISQVSQLRMVGAVDEGRAITFLAHVTPDGTGTRLAVSQWRLAGDGDAPSPPAPTEALLHQLAVVHAVLDADQRVLATDLRGDAADGDADASALADLAALWQAEAKPWSDAVDLIGVAHRQPLHWRLLDDVAFRIAGSARTWRARLLPHGDAGFDLLVLPDAIDVLPVAPSAPETPSAAEPAPGWSRVIGRDLAPALRQPINRIVANAETIRTRLAGPLADEYAAYAADIAEAGRHLLGLVEDLADLDAVEAPGFAPAPDRIDLADCARRAAGILAMRAQERGIVLVTPDDTVSVPATGEFRRVLQILLNLLTNAIRYGPEHSTVSITAATDGSVAHVTVSDQGAGLTVEQAAQVFDKFERLGRSGDGGSGLGLYISRRLARAMGGDLKAEDVAVTGTGARFVLTLPGRS
ncbi:HAMP domain-containing sensor histidine kinase [Novosphingobium sp.]|uniref:sensor histidine kinase n=1 Tax=Novosphingobium sp. TaxID=1874826 RepID=UPI00333E4226